MPTGLTIVKRITYRGNANEEFSNTYWFTGATPADAAAWSALALEISTEEKTLFPSDVRTVRYYGYDDDSDDRHSVWTKDISASPIIGSIPGGAFMRAAGDAAVWIRWQTNRLTVKGKKIYLRKYYHPAIPDPAELSGNTVYPTQLTNMNAFGAKMMNGTLATGRKLTSRGHTETLVASNGSPYITTRTLKRRGKRPGA